MIIVGFPRFTVIRSSLTSPGTLRFPELNEIESLAVQGGLELTKAFVSWAREPFIDNSSEIIIRLTKGA